MNTVYIYNGFFSILIIFFLLFTKTNNNQLCNIFGMNTENMQKKHTCWIHWRQNYPSVCV